MQKKKNRNKKREKIENEMKEFNIERKEREIRWKDIAGKVNAVRHACKALEHLNKRIKYKKIVGYTKMHRVCILNALFFF